MTNEKYRVFTATGPNGMVVTVVVNYETFAAEPNAADYFRPGCTNIKDHGTFEPVGDGANWLPDYWECR